MQEANVVYRTFMVYAETEKCTNFWSRLIWPRFNHVYWPHQLVPFNMLPQHLLAIEDAVDTLSRGYY